MSILNRTSENSSFQTISILLCALACLCFSCIEEKVETIHLSGNWLVDKTLRNGRATTTLEDAFFDFNSDSTFVTNIFSEVKMYDLETTEHGFKQIGTQEIEYNILKQNEDTLMIESIIQDYHFIFLTLRDTTTIEVTE